MADYPKWMWDLYNAQFDKEKVKKILEDNHLPIEALDTVHTSGEPHHQGNKNFKVPVDMIDIINSFRRKPQLEVI